MKKIFCSILSFIFLAACYHSAPEPTFNMALVLPADSMESLLTDIHIADGIVSVLKNKQQPAGKLSSEYFNAILDNHALSREAFEESMRYYAYHTEELDKIYEQVITDLSKKESLVHQVSDTLKPAE
jgi:hypothetical protein